MAWSTRLKLFVGLTGDESEASSRHKRRRGSRPRELARETLDAAVPALNDRLRLRLRLRDLFLAYSVELPSREYVWRLRRLEVLRAREATEASKLLEPDSERSRLGDRDAWRHRSRDLSSSPLFELLEAALGTSRSSSFSSLEMSRGGLCCVSGSGLSNMSS